MLIEKSGLPFPRGTTFSQCSKAGLNPLVTLADTTAKNLEGRKFQVPDTIHNTGEFIVLRVVKNHNGSALGTTRLIHKFSTASKDDWGHRIAGVADANGTLMGKPMDDAYWYGTENTANHDVFSTIPDNDLFYVVEEGPCHVLCETTTKFSVGQAAAVSDTNGHAAAAAGNDDSFGTAGEINDTAAVTAALFYIKAGIQGETP